MWAVVAELNRSLQGQSDAVTTTVRPRGSSKTLAFLGVRVTVARISPSNIQSLALMIYTLMRDFAKSLSPSPPNKNRNSNTKGLRFL